MPLKIRPAALWWTAGVVALALVTGFVLRFGANAHDRQDGRDRSGQPVGVLRTGAESLRGRTIVIDPGHNGGNAAAGKEIGRLVPAGGFNKECDTVGTQTDAGYAEHALTFDLARRAATILQSRGATVTLTRDDDTGVGPCVDQRAWIGNDAHADVAVSIHADGAPARARGFHVIAPALSPDHANASILAPSARVASALRAAFGQASGLPPADYLGRDGVTSRTDLGGLNLSRVPKVFIECGNMRNDADALAFTDPAWRARASVGLADGLTAYLQNVDVTPASPPGG